MDSVLDDFDHQMMDEANINCPDEFSAGGGAGGGYNQANYQRR
jgi:hypothetical protein